jgi:hypothetical protein
MTCESGEPRRNHIERVNQRTRRKNLSHSSLEPIYLHILHHFFEEFRRVLKAINFFYKCRTMTSFQVRIALFGLPRRNPTTGVLVTEGNVLGRQTGLWSTEAKASCRRVHGTEVLTAVPQTIPSGHRAAPRRMYGFYSHGLCWW